MIDSPPLLGLVAATFTPFRPDGNVDYEKIPALAEHLSRNGVRGIYVCGSTGEGPSLTISERKKVAEAYRRAAGDSMRTIIHVGHTSIGEVQELAAHAHSIGADAISAVAPHYFKPQSAEDLVAFFEKAIATAPDLPFYYYHIPALTGLSVSPVDFLKLAAERMPTLRGIKYTDSDLSGLSHCQDVGDFDVLFGRDEMLLSSLVLGVRGAVGSTYNLAPALYVRIIEEYERGDHEKARELQKLSARMIRAIVGAGGESAIKYPMHRHGLGCGPRRLPMASLSPEQEAEIDRRLDELGFDEWSVG